MNKIVICMVLLILAATGLPAEPVSALSGRTGTVVLSQPGNGFSVLAEEIALKESIPLAGSWEDAFSHNPQFVLWVTRATDMSYRSLIEAGLKLKALQSFPAVGLITGRTEESARQLYERAGSVHSGRIYAVNGEEQQAGIREPLLWSFAGGSGTPAVLTDELLFAALAAADYLTFTGYGRGDQILIHEWEQGLTATKLPPLKPVVVSSAGDETFRPWLEDSIAVAFIEHGAAAYAGSVFNSLNGCLLGQYTDLPFRYTSPEFPIGIVVAMQSRATLRGYAWFPYYFLIGDPRICLQSAPPYRSVSERAAAGGIELSYEGNGSGLIPVKIAGGEKYKYLAIPGTGTFCDDDPFFNSRILSYGQNGDRYILFRHTGGPFSLRLHPRAPLFRGMLNPLAVSLDNFILLSPQPLGRVNILILVLGLFFSFLFFIILKKRWETPLFPKKRLLLFSSLFGAATALSFAAWQLCRLPYAAVTMQPLTAFDPVWTIGIFLLWGSGAGIFLAAQTLWGKIAGWLAILLTTLAPALLMTFFIGAINHKTQAELGSDFIGYTFVVISLIPTAVFAVVIAVVLPLLKQAVPRTRPDRNAGAGGSRA